MRVLVVPDPTEVALPAYPGRAEAGQELELGFEVAGRMLERPAEVGDSVRRGQLLAQLDLRDFRAELDRAKAASKRTSERLVRIREAVANGNVRRVFMGRGADTDTIVACYQGEQ